MIKMDFEKWQALLCYNDNNSHMSPQEVAFMTFDAIAGFLLPKELQHSGKQYLLQNYLNESLYILE